MLKPFDINPSTNMMDVLGFSGYTLNFNIADIINNSISSHTKNIYILFDINNDKVCVFILDDDGMDFNKLYQCMIPAYKDLNDVRCDDD